MVRAVAWHSSDPGLDPVGDFREEGWGLVMVVVVLVVLLFSLTYY